MMHVTEFIKTLKYIEEHRETYYDNHFPANCGQIHPNGVLSFDCINLPKSVINYPKIATKTSPVGFYVQPGLVIPDYDELHILTDLCTDVEWGAFRNTVPGSYLYMEGHAGIFAGNYVDGSGTVNTIECTTDWGANGVTTSYMDMATGRRFDHLGGIEMRGWEAHGKLKYIDYKKKEEKSMFNDVKKSNKYYEVYKAMVDAGIMTIDKNGNFRPKKHVTRGALAVCLYRVMKKAKMIK